MDNYNKSDSIAQLFDYPAVNDADTTAPLSRWKLLRQDDNGHIVEVSRFCCRSKALKKLAERERRAHKQTYIHGPAHNRIELPSAKQSQSTALKKKTTFVSEMDRRNPSFNFDVPIVAKVPDENSGGSKVHPLRADET